MKLQKINKGLSEAVLDANKPTRVEPANIKPVDMDYGTQERIAKREDEVKAKIAADIEPLKDVAETTKGEDKAILGKDIKVKEMLCKDRKEVGKALESLRAKGIKCRVSRAADGENRYKVTYTESLEEPIKESRSEGGRNVDAKDHLPKSLGRDAGKSRRGVVGAYKGYSIHDVGSSFVVTDKNGATVLQTKWGLPIIYDMIDDMERGSKGPNGMPLGEARHKFEVLWYEGDNAEDALQGDYHSKEFSSEQAAMRFYEKSKDDANKYGFWVTERDSDWDVVRDIVTESILDRQAKEEHPLDEGKHGHSKRVAPIAKKSLAEPKEGECDGLGGAHGSSIEGRACSDCDDDDIDSCPKIDEDAAHAMVGDKPIVQEAREASPIQQANDFATASMDSSTASMLEGDDNI